MFSKTKKKKMKALQQMPPQNPQLTDFCPLCGREFENSECTVFKKCGDIVYCYCCTHSKEEIDENFNEVVQNTIVYPDYTPYS